MAMSKGANTYNRMNWEDSEFPILCETCLGDNPYVRMMRETHGKECKICTRPFTVFRWSPGKRARYKKTEICQTCAKLKNVCQTCILDLEYGLPVEVRDKALKLEQNLPKSDVNREYYQQQLEASDDGEQRTVPYGELGKARAPSDMLLKLARTTPYYKRNRPHICSFWVKGECRRGEECPYRHEKPTDPDDPLADQNIRDRFYGTSDPVAEKLMQKYDTMPKLTPPDDRTITTLYIGGLTDVMTEQDLRDHFYQFGELRSISMHQKQSCAFVQFTSREAAEKAAEKSYDKLIIRGRRLNIRWGKSQAAGAGDDSRLGEAGKGLDPVPGLPGALPMPPPDIAAYLPPMPPPPGLSMPPPPPPPPGGLRPPIPPPMPPPAPPMHLQHMPPPPPRPLVGLQPPLDKNIEPPPPGTVPVRLVDPAPPTVPQMAQMLPGWSTSNIHYPSQDPSRMGSFTAGPSRQQ